MASKNKEDLGLFRTLLEALLVCFITLKVSGVVNWSWWIVTLPFTAPFSIAMILILIAYLKLNWRA